MDTATAMIGDISMADELSKNSQFVAESKRSPHFQKMLVGLSEIAGRNNHLSESELKQLERDRENLFTRQVINSIKDIADVEYANEETVVLSAIMSKHSNSFTEGLLSVKTKFTAPIIEVLKRVAYSGSTGTKINEDGTRDHTAHRVAIASDNVMLRDIGNLSIDDKRRAIKATEVINADDSKDPYVLWEENRRKVEEARLVRAERAAGAPMQKETSGSSVNWASFV